MTKSNLKYFYCAHYKDGTSYKQNEYDISVANPEKSCYYDVKLDDVVTFALSDGDTTYTLDLRDGGFSINNGPKFYITTDVIENPKLNHFRRVTLNFEDSRRVMTINYVLGFTMTDKAYNIIIK